MGGEKDEAFSKVKGFMLEIKCPSTRASTLMNYATPPQGPRNLTYLIYDLNAIVMQHLWSSLRHSPGALYPLRMLS